MPSWERLAFNTAMTALTKMLQLNITYFTFVNKSCVREHGALMVEITFRQSHGYSNEIGSKFWEAHIQREPRTYQLFIVCLCTGHHPGSECSQESCLDNEAETPRDDV